METRIRDKNIEITSDATKSFWQSRISKGYNLKSVLLNEDAEDNQILNRNTKESNLLKSFLDENKKYKILDIGCGIGRWVSNLHNFIEQYTGIDYTNGFIELAKNKYKQFNVNFIQMSVTSIDLSALFSSYDLSILTGVCMYINDKDLPKLFSVINALTTQTIYLQESVSLTNERLTLKEYYSNDLKRAYSAIYRIIPEYESFLKNYCTNFKLVSKGLLLDAQTGKREETNAAYWILKRSSNDRK